MERLIDKLREHLKLCQGKIVTLRDLRVTFKIEPGSKDDSNLRTHMSVTLVREKIVRTSGRKDGDYKVVTQVKPVRVFTPGRERRPIFELKWIRDTITGEEISIGKSIVIREGDLITLGGVKSKGKTTICLGMSAMNIHRRPVLMGNEYTVLAGNKDGLEEYEPAPRFLSRLDRMSEWVDWTDEDGQDLFYLLPVREDYAEHIIKDRINIIDWINLDGDKSYDIGKVLDGIKTSLGRGIAIVALQKGEGSVNPRGGQFVRDFSDVEIHLDGLGSSDDDIRLTVKGCKEKTSQIVGKTYAYTIIDGGTAIRNFREIKKCPICSGSGERWVKGEGKIPCQDCYGDGWIDKYDGEQT